MSPAFKGNNIRSVQSLRSQVEQFRSWFKPRIGTLYHYPPKPVHIPSRYYRSNNLNSFPRISIVTPSFNSVNFIGATLESVFEQNYPNLEYVVQDGGSEDGTVDIIRKYGAQLFHWESKKDNGQASAINIGFKQTSGEIMAYLNSDDVLLPGALRYISRYFIKNPNVDVIYGHRILINENNDEIGRWIIPSNCNYTTIWHDFIPQETLFWRRSVWENVGGYIDEAFQFAMDWDLILRFQKVGAKFRRLPRFLGAMRVHESMKSISKIDSVGEEEMNILRRRYEDPNITDKQLERYIKSYLNKHVLLNTLYRLGFVKY